MLMIGTYMYMVTRLILVERTLQHDWLVFRVCRCRVFGHVIFSGRLWWLQASRAQQHRLKNNGQVLDSICPSTMRQLGRVPFPLSLTIREYTDLAELKESDQLADPAGRHRTI